MELNEALSQIEVIRSQMARTETFRGYRSATVACTSVLAFAAATAQTLFLPEPQRSVEAYLALWLCVAAACVGLVAFELAVRWRRCGSRWSRQAIGQAVERFVPCIVAGGAITWGVAGFHMESVSLLPGLWAIIFSLGVFASWRQLSPAVFGVAWFYLVAGLACLIFARDEHALSPWAMACTFGVGQMLTAVILRLSVEVKHGEE